MVSTRLSAKEKAAIIAAQWDTKKNGTSRTASTTATMAAGSTAGKTRSSARTEKAETPSKKTKAVAKGKKSPNPSKETVIKPGTTKKAATGGRSNKEKLAEVKAKWDAKRKGKKRPEPGSAKKVAIGVRSNKEKLAEVKARWETKRKGKKTPEPGTAKKAATGGRSNEEKLAEVQAEWEAKSKGEKTPEPGDSKRAPRASRAVLNAKKVAEEGRENNRRELVLEVEEEEELDDSVEEVPVVATADGEGDGNGKVANKICKAAGIVTAVGLVLLLATTGRVAAPATFTAMVKLPTTVSDLPVLSLAIAPPVANLPVRMERPLLALPSPMEVETVSDIPVPPEDHVSAVPETLSGSPKVVSTVPGTIPRRRSFTGVALRWILGQVCTVCWFLLRLYFKCLTGTYGPDVRMFFWVTTVVGWTVRFFVNRTTAKRQLDSAIHECRQRVVRELRSHPSRRFTVKELTRRVNWYEPVFERRRLARIMGYLAKRNFDEREVLGIASLRDGQRITLYQYRPAH